MPNYRLYRLDGAGRISTAEWLDAADDEEARSRAGAQCSGVQYELWLRKRLVERIAKKPR